MYECFRDDYQKVLDIYGRFVNTREFFYTLRNFDRDPNYVRCDRFFKAARFIWISKNAFGTTRYNLKGQMNQSYSARENLPLTTRIKDIQTLSNLLQTTEIKEQSFEETLKYPLAGDVVYLDPPYIDTKYDRYWKTKFKLEDMERLKGECDKLNSRGVKFILSHSKNEAVGKLFNDYEVAELNVTRDIKFTAPTIDLRTDQEYIITNI